MQWRTRLRDKQPFAVRATRKRGLRTDESLEEKPEVFSGEFEEFIKTLTPITRSPADREFNQNVEFSVPAFKQVVRFFLDKGFRPPTEAESRLQGFDPQTAQEGVGDFDEPRRGIVGFAMQKPSGGTVISAYIVTDKINIAYGILHDKPYRAAQLGESMIEELKRKRRELPSEPLTFTDEEFRREFRDIAIIYDNLVNEYRGR